MGRGERGTENTWRSLSFAPYLTKVVLYKILAYCLILFLVIKNVERSEQARRMIYVVIFMGVFQAVYGLIDFFTGHNYIFYYQKVYGGKLVTGIFINRNHLAGYLEMVIPLALAFCLDKLEKKRFDRRVNWRDKLQNRQIDSVFNVPFFVFSPLPLFLTSHLPICGCDGYCSAFFPLANGHHRAVYRSGSDGPGS